MLVYDLGFFPVDLFHGRLFHHLLGRSVTNKVLVQAQNSIDLMHHDIEVVRDDDDRQTLIMKLAQKA